MHKLIRKLLGKLNIMFALVLMMMASGLGTVSYVLASATSNLTQTINAGSLATDILDASYVTVGSPTVAMSVKTFSFSCLSGGSASAGTFGTASQVIYVQNPDAADNGWTLTLAASSPAANWTSAGTSMDFNDPTSSGCTDGADADSLKGQMTVDPSVGTLAVGQCSTCATTNVTKGSSNAFNESTVDSITLLTGAAGSDDIGDWKLTGVSIKQTIPAEQPAASDYNISLTLTATAS